MAGGYSGPSPMKVLTPAQKAAAAAKTNPYPNDPNAKFINGQWVDVPSNGRTPAQVAATAAKAAKASKNAPKLNKSAFQKWLTSNTPTKPTALDFDPTKGFPTEPALTAYPGLDTLPDGSDVPDSPAMTFKRTGASLLDPKQYANLEGQKAYQPIIDALTSQQSRLSGGISSANDMVDRAYGGAADQSLKGADIVRQNTAQGNQTLTDLAAKLAGIAGGDPTATGAIGQTTADEQATNSRLAGVSEQTQADQAAASARDAGTAKLAYKGATDASIADLATKLATAKQQGSQAQGAAIKDALGFNDQMRTSALGRDVSQQEARLAAAIAGPQITAANLGNANTRQGLQINAHNAQVNDWTNINTSTRQKYLDAVTRVTDKATAQQMKQALIQGKTPAAELALADPAAYASIKSGLDQSFTTKNGPAVNPGVMYTQTVKQLHSAYPDSSSKAIKALALRYAQSQMPMWNAQHDKGQQNSGKTWKLVNGVPALVKA